MYTRQQKTTQQDLSAFGMPAEMLAVVNTVPDDVAVWPEHETAVEIFAAMSTQWRVGFAGATGMDYAALPAVMDCYAVPEDKRRDVFSEVRVMEDEALTVLHEGKA